MATMASKMSFAMATIADSTSQYVEEMIQIKEKIHELIDYAKKFDSTAECEAFVRTARYEHIVLIITPNIIDEIFQSNIHQIRHVQSIFVFDPKQLIDSNYFHQLRRSSYKMQEISRTPDDLYQNLWQWIQEFASWSNVLLSTLSKCPSQAMTTNVINNVADFAEYWYILYIDFLLDLPIIDPIAERMHFIEQCRIHFARNPGILEQINNFEMNYSPKKALFYYSCDGFIYRLINRALREQSIDGITCFRFILIDIRNQLREEFQTFLTATCQDDFFQVFYRGQRMTHEELKELQKKHRAGTLITTNSYFSTSMNRMMAREFAGESTNEKGIIPVLFEITAHITNTPKIQRKPFAFISTHSQFGSVELEVLFSIGSFFKISKIFYHETDLVWIVEMNLIEDYDTKLEVTKDYCLLQACPPEAMIIKIGNLLADHPRQGIPVAVAFYQMITKFNFSESLTLACRVGLGCLALKQKKLPLAIELQQSALDDYHRLFQSARTDLNHLCAMSYNCIGTAHRLKREYKQALDFFLKAEELAVKVPIDKYAMYEGYRNITAVNIASIYKLIGDVGRAWEIYKMMLAHESDASIRYHGRTYLTIAQAGLFEAQINHDIVEYERCSLSWKAFLDISLTSMSSSYRRSIISGVLLLGFEYANNERTRTMAIDYFKKVIEISRKYVHVNRDDHLIVLQCQNQVSRLYTKMQNYDQAMAFALDALEMCNEHDLTDLIDCYESMIQIFEQRLCNEKVDSPTDDITRLIMGENQPPPSTIVFDRSEFAFGQFSINKINRDVLQATNRKCQLVYCLLKSAALTQMQAYKEKKQNRIEPDDGLNKQAQLHAGKTRQLLRKASELLRDDPSIRGICLNNMSYLDKKFDSITQYYLQDLRSNHGGKPGACIGEDAFCYLAHLHGRRADIITKHHWYERGVKHFHEYGYICEHTVGCFQKLAHFYEKEATFGSPIDVYQNLIDHLLKYQSPCFLHTSIKPIVMKLVEYFTEKDQIKQAIAILHQFVELIRLKDNDGGCQIDAQFKKIIKSCNNEHVPISQAYTNYLEVILRYKPVTPDSYIRAIEPAFRQALSTYQIHNNHYLIIKTSERFIQLLLEVNNGRSNFEAAFKELALDLEKSSLFQIAIHIYTYLGNFIINYQNRDDFILAGFVISRCKFLKQKDLTVNNDTQQMLIDLMVFYHDAVHPQFIVDDYLKTMKDNYEPQSTTGIYMSLLVFCFKHRPEHYIKYMETNIAALMDRPQELIAFLTSKRVDYKVLIRTLFKQYGNKVAMTHRSDQLYTDFKDHASQWLWSKEETDDKYWSELFYLLLEFQSKDDECIASCYMKINDVRSAVSVFDTELYEDPALKYNSNACRRYLQYVYPSASSEQRTYLEHRYHDHFLILYDSSFQSVSYEILLPE